MNATRCLSPVILTVWLMSYPSGGTAPPPAPITPPVVTGWQVDGTPVVYGADNLFEYINGADELYFRFHFRRLTVLNWTNGQGGVLTAELYHHAGPWEAFGIYAQERPRQGRFLNIGTEAYGDQLTLNFLKGEYYVKIGTYGAGAAGTAAMERLARSLAASLPGGTDWPEPLRLFPAEGRLPRSETFAVTDFLDVDGLGPAFSANYPNPGGAELRAFVVVATDAAAGAAARDRLLALDRSVAKPADGTPARLHPADLGPLLLVRRGRHVWGVLGDPTPARQAVLDALGQALRRAPPTR